MKTEIKNQHRTFLKYGLVALLGIVSLSIFVFHFAFPLFVNEGSSMLPTIGNTSLRLNPYIYSFSEPKRGDIIVFISPNTMEANAGVRLIKRIIGIPFDTIEFRNQQLYVNDVLLDEPYLAEPCRASNCPDESWTLSEGEYFVMGDNRNHSLDSRRYGAIQLELIVGQVMN